MEVRVSVAQALHRSEDRRDPAPSRVRELPDPRREGGGARGADSQARELPYAAPFLRYAPARGGLRHTYGAGAPRPQERRDDDDLHARDEQGRQRRKQSARPLARLMSQIADWSRRRSGRALA